MKLYVASVYNSSFDLHGRVFSRLDESEKQARLGVKHILESYHYIYKQSFVDKIRRDKTAVFLDSGAFSAFTKGIDVDIKGYCRYIKENEDIIYKDDGVLCASVLDGIGDPLKTWQNQLLMESLGVTPLPCFHYGEDERYLEWYIERYPYITIGGMVAQSTPQLKLWLDRIWEEHLCDSAGRPRVKVHGFGLTTLSLMTRYPWYSVDSSTWVQHGSNGMIQLPGYGQIYISDRSPNRKIDGQHYRNHPEQVRQTIANEIRRLGFDPERLEQIYLSRWAFNLWAYPVEGEKNQLTEFKREQQGLF